MVPERGPGGQMHYLMVPPFPTPRQVKQQSAVSAGWAVPSEMHGHVRPVVHAAVPLNMMQAFPAQHLPDQQVLPHDTSRVLRPESVPEQGCGQVAPSQQVYGQPHMSQAGILMTHRMPLGVGNHSRQPLISVSPPRCVSTAVPEGGFCHGARAVADVATKREDTVASLPCPPEGQSLADAKNDGLFSPEDELSLSTTLFNLSLEQNGLVGLTGSFGRVEDCRQESDSMGGSFGRQLVLEARGGHSAPRGVTTGCGYGGGAASAPCSDRALTGHVTSTDLSQDQQWQTPIDEAYRRPRLDFTTTTSVSELLFAPTQVRMGVVGLAQLNTPHASF